MGNGTLEDGTRWLYDSEDELIKTVHLAPLGLGPNGFIDVDKQALDDGFMCDVDGQIRLAGVEGDEVASLSLKYKDLTCQWITHLLHDLIAEKTGEDFEMTPYTADIESAAFPIDVLDDFICDTREMAKLYADAADINEVVECISGPNSPQRFLMSRSCCAWEDVYERFDEFDFIFLADDLEHLIAEANLRGVKSVIVSMTHESYDEEEYDEGW